MHTVCLGASRSVGSNYGWKNYDTQFRLKKESNPTMFASCKWRDAQHAMRNRQFIGYTLGPLEHSAV